MSFNDSNGLKKNLKRSPTFSFQSTNNEKNGPIPHSTTSLIVRRYNALGESPPKSSVQRLIDTFETENRRHFAEFERVNNDLKVKFLNI